MTLLEELKIIYEKLAIIIHGNPKYEKHAKNVYNKLETILKNKNYDVEHDLGLPKTMPKRASIWLGFSRGEDRFNYSKDKRIKKISIGGTKGNYIIRNPKDLSYKKDDVPDKEHFIFTDKMKDQLEKII